jgi:hypothetical protein
MRGQAKRPEIRRLGFLTAGTYRINPALFEVVTVKLAHADGMRER